MLAGRSRSVHYEQCRQSSDDEEERDFYYSRKPEYIRSNQDHKKLKPSIRIAEDAENKLSGTQYGAPAVQKNDVMTPSYRRQDSVESTDSYVKHVTWDIEQGHMSRDIQLNRMTSYDPPRDVFRTERSISSDEGFPQGRRSRIQAAHDLDFDQLFEHPELTANLRRDVYTSRYGDSVDEGISSFEFYEDSPTYPTSFQGMNENEADFRSTSPSGFPRTDSIHVIDLAFTDIMKKHKNNSQGFLGFRRRMANDINSKYCSYLRCDDVLFLFLYTVFGMIYISAGSLGILHCPEYSLINVYLIVDGILSIFVFPVSIMKWTKQIGGCLNEDEKLGRGVFFFTIIGLRTVAGTLGTVILVYRGQTLTSEEVMCRAIVTLLDVGVALEWAFLFFGIILPTCFYVGIYVYANKYL